MPVGTSFENSAMKTSFSLSSLQAPVDSTPEKGVVKPRLCSSLTKKRIKATAVRRSWGSTASEHREEFWSALQANYNYIMDNQLIDKCQEANSDLSMDTGTWSLKEFDTQFSELYLWLNSVQEIIYGKEENILDKALRAHCVNMVHEKSPSLALFNDQASQLVQLHPEVQEEVGWRVTHLNSKWDSILSILEPSECGHCEQDNCLDIDHEIRCLRKWFKMMESCLEPLNFRAKYTKTEIETKGLELKVLHRDIENHGKIVGSVVKLCRRSDASCNTVNVRRIANGLERRWHLLFLRSLEWQCYLESLSKKENSRNTFSSSEETDDSDCYEEPVNKYPRLSENNSVHKEKIFEDDSDDIREQSEIYEDVMNRNGVEFAQINNGEDIVDGNFNKFPEDTSQFTRSNRKAPNLGTYYFKHEDTDSDMDKIEQHSVISKNEVQSTLEETSEEEDEWIYTKNDVNNPVGNDEINIKPKPIPEDKIRKLVLKAEELVSPDKSNKLKIHSINKMTRVKKWLSMDKPDDSCDASGEDDEKESQLSEDFDESTTTFRATQGYNSQNTSFTELNNSENSTTKVSLRQKKTNGNRPWSVSCISQLHQSSPKVIQNDLTNFSISESALHQLTLTPQNLERLNAISANSIGINNCNSSSTVEENCQISQGKTSPNRRRRLKFKKNKTLCGKFESHTSTPYNTLTCQKNRNILIKSGSFSGCNTKIAYNNERHTSSDPPAINLYQQGGKYENSTTSGADSEDDINKRMIPTFKLGSKTHYLKSTDLRDSSPGTCSFNTTEEQSSSLSEQAWDSYQEKYLSEAYSEAHDSDAARKLLEFGEDYRNFIDSQSDWSTNPDFSPTFRRKALLAYSQTDSDNDTESLRQLLNNSKDQLNYTKDIYNQQFILGANNYLVANEMDEMISTCDRHIDLLHHIEKSSDEFSMSKADKGIVSELLTQWQNLRSNVLKMQEYRNLQKDILQLKKSLMKIEIPYTSCMIDLGSVDDLPKEVDQCEKKLEDILELKKKLLALNVAVHRFVVENKDYNANSLKVDISELYRIWDGIYTSTNERLAQLQPLLQAWKTLENRLEQLQIDLRGDEETLHLLDTALQGGDLCDQTAGYVRDVAKLLSETTTIQGCRIPELFTEGGSLSDSGISDEGSEHELGERERRLAAIRRLVRQLEVVLAPDCKARLKMAERLTAAEEELKALQKRCRNLIVCTAAYSNSTRSSSQQNDTIEPSCSTKEPDGDDDDPGNESEGTSWFKRVMRASVPFQVVIITLLCVACLLEPQCCDNMNNFAMSLSPQLRYIKGPPPI